ncbi:hypothetical protein F8M41_001501 [Gigaspora margarita]|uniref:Uncharacterized protein n=1 Tax=Gigaspora margarita TaxID=4874 RepID=A0A8H3XGA5_GIGMA|nr:hypothetical protein F8M41_001501 [Gigaspora margarita]
MYELITVKGVITLATKLRIPKTEILIKIINESNFTLTNVTMYFNGTSINPASLNIAPFTDPSNMDAKLPTNKLEVPLFGKNEFCVHIGTNRPPEEPKEKNLFRKHIYKEYKKVSYESIQTGYKDFRVSATMSNG